MEPTSGFYDFAEGLGEGWQDGVAIDACGYLYVPDFWSRTLFRVAPDGTHEEYVSWRTRQEFYGHGVVWGTGVGGFREDALDLPLPYNSNLVTELIVGVPSKDWDGRVVNAPMP